MTSHWTPKLRPLPECSLVSLLSENTLVGHQGAVTAVLLLSEEPHRREFHHRRHYATSEFTTHGRCSGQATFLAVGEVTTGLPRLHTAPQSFVAAR